MPPPDDQTIASLIHMLNQLSASQHRTEERLARLEGLISPKAWERETPVATPPAVAKEPKTQEPSLETVSDIEPAKVPVEAEPEPVIVRAHQPELETKVGLTILNRIGVITLVLGVGFFFKWAVDNNWIGPSGRVILGLLAGLLTLFLGDYLWRKGQLVFAQGITGAGVAIIYLAFYAAFDFYHLIPQAAAFVLLLATTAMAATLAIRYAAQAIAALGSFGAYLIPWLLSNGEDRPWFLIAYLLLINIAATELAIRRKWRGVEILSFVATLCIFGGYALSQGGRAESQIPSAVGLTLLVVQRFRTPVRLLFAAQAFLSILVLSAVLSNRPLWFSFFILVISAAGLAFAHFREDANAGYAVFTAFWLAVALSRLQLEPQHMTTITGGFVLFAGWTWWRTGGLREPLTVTGMSMFALNGIAFYGFAYSILRQHEHGWLGLLAVAVAAYYLASATFLRRGTERHEENQRVVLLALGVSVAFLTLAIPIQLTGFTVTIAWSIQAAALTWIGVRLSSKRAVIGGMIVFALAVLQVATVDAGMYQNANSYSLLVNSRFLTFAALGAALLLAAYWSSRLDKLLAVIQFGAGHIVLLAGLTLEVLGWAERNARPENLASVETLGTTILFAIYAVALVSLGVIKRLAISRIAGLQLTAVVVLKLYLFDVWQLDRVYQIIAFVILGVLLLSTSFLYSRFKNLVNEWRKDDQVHS